MKNRTKNRFVAGVCVILAFVCSGIATAGAGSYGTKYGNIRTVVNGQTLSFRQTGENSAELTAGNYSGRLIIPAWVEHGGKLLEVTSIGEGAFCGSGITEIIVPPTVKELDNPFRLSTSAQAPVKSVRFFSRPEHFRGIIPHNALTELKKMKEPVKAGDKWQVSGFKVTDILPYHLLAVRSDRTGGTGITSYDSTLIPFEYEDFDAMYSDWDGYFSFGVVVKKDGKWGMVDFNNKVLIPFKYDSPDRMGSAKKIEKKMHKAFGKVYGDLVHTVSEDMSYTIHDAAVPYLMWLCGFMKDFTEFQAGEALAALKAKLPFLFEDKEDTESEEDEGVYSGPVNEAGLPHGKGTYTVREADYYNDMSALVLLGEERQYYTEDVYEGLWADGMKYGDFTMTRSDKIDCPEGLDSSLVFTVSGFIIGDEVYGDATMDYPDGYKYVGQVTDGWKRNGYGTEYSPDGSYYRGEWENNDFISGNARVVYNDGSIYAGAFAGMEPAGQGKLTFPDGTWVEGVFRGWKPFGEYTVCDINGKIRKKSYGEPSYLSVNGETSLNVRVPHYSSSKTFQVGTDWSSFEVSGLPSWAKLSSKTASSFTLRIEANNSVSVRSSTFRVRAGNKSVRIYLLQDEDKYAVSGEIEKSWVVYGATRGMGMYMTQGIEVHVAFNVNNLLDKKCQAAVYFEFSNGQVLNDLNGQYRASNGQVAAYENFRPPYTGTTYNDFTLYIPYYELHLAPGQHDLRYIVQIFGPDGKLVCSSGYFNFSLMTW